MLEWLLYVEFMFLKKAQQSMMSSWPLQSPEKNYNTVTTALNG